MKNKINILQTDKSWIETKAIDQLTKTAELPGIIKAAGLPDLHPGKTPIGAVYLSEDIIYPQLIGNDIGCGLTLFSLGIPEKKFKQERIIKKLNQLDSRVDEIDLSLYTANCLFPHQEKLGTIGSGNHFAEFQKVDKVYHEEAFRNIGIEQNEIVLLVHSGSRTFGEDIFNRYLNDFPNQTGLIAGGKGFDQYMKEHQEAFAFAQLNRQLIAQRILSYVNLQVQSKLLESVHNGIFEKVIEGKRYFIHRKGAASADHGYVVVAGSRGSNSYIVEPLEEAKEYLFSIAHGAGRKWSRSNCKERLEKIYSKKAIREDSVLNSNIIYKNKDLIYQEAPEAYKNIERVIEDMLSVGIIRVIATLKPLITYKA